jgi:hypothetical protein
MRILKAAIYGISPTDPLTFIAITLILGAVALLACYIPARRRRVWIRWMRCGVSEYGNWIALLMQTSFVLI